MCKDRRDFRHQLVQTITGVVDGSNTYLRTNLLLANRGVLDSVATKWNTTTKAL